MAKPFDGALRRMRDPALTRLRDTRTSAMRATEHYVAASPYMTIAIAAAVGLALGLLIMASRPRGADDRSFD